MNPPAPNLHPGCLALGLLGLLAACQPPNLDPADYPRSEPKLADVAGVYVLTADSLKEVRERGHYPAAATSITLASDCTVAKTRSRSSSFCPPTIMMPAKDTQ